MELTLPKIDISELYPNRIPREVLADRVLAQRLAQWMLKHWPDVAKDLSLYKIQSPDEYPFYTTPHQIKEPLTLAIYIKDKSTTEVLGEVDIHASTKFLNNFEDGSDRKSVIIDALLELSEEFENYRPIMSFRRTVKDQRDYLAIRFGEFPYVLATLAWSRYFANEPT